MKKSKCSNNNYNSRKKSNKKMNNGNNYSTNEDSSTGSSRTNSTESEFKYEELIAQINQLNISFDALLVVLLAIILNIYYLYYSKIQVLDNINNTNCADLLIDASSIPNISNAMFLYSTGVFLEINYVNYENLNSVQGEERDIGAINRAYRAFFSTILVLIATALSRSNLEV